MPEDLKETQKALETCFREYRSRVDASRNMLTQAERAYKTKVDAALSAREKAATPAKIASIGVIQRVVLTETSIKTPKGEHRLTPDVKAHAEQHGNKQVVQGWVFKSDNDRREVYLHLNGPDWGVVVPFNIKNSLSQPRELHEFATKVNVAARTVEQTQARIAAECRRADAAIAAARRDRGAIEAAAEAFVAATWSVEDLRRAATIASATAAGLPSDRKARKLAELATSVGQSANGWAAEAEQARERVKAESASVLRGLEPAQPTPALPAPASASEPEPAVALPSEGDIFELIRKLGELRDAGLVTPEEFEAKKAELLARL